MNTARRLTIAAFAPLLLTSLVLADDQPPGMRHAVRQINTEKKVILAFVYPSVTFDGIEANGYRLTSSGFEIDLTFDWTDGNDTGWTKLKMGFDKSGKVISVRPTGSSSLWPPFGTAKLTLELIKASIRNDQNATPESRKLLTINDPQLFLVEYMKSKDN